ncbi:hypothetical protein [Halopiger goleimassiliensis]|uniref:hypothetical protein n=1 Tax=Halopiger goleimassiliensis TaxID=1293048 RepID=UPI000677AE6C|nr:hypothetical protein [Halopiger goleimassiliensis]
MSTTAHPLDEVQDRDQADRVFRRYVFEDSSCCSNCFRRIKSDHVRLEWGAEGNDVDPKATCARSVREHKTKPGEIGPEGPLQGAEQVEITTKARYPTRTFCDDCGSVSGRADDESMTRREALRRAETLAVRLEEVGEPVDVEVLKKLVGHLKSQPRFTGYDTEVFEAATTVAIRHARNRRQR